MTDLDKFAKSLSLSMKAALLQLSEVPKSWMSLPPKVLTEMTRAGLIRIEISEKGLELMDHLAGKDREATITQFLDIAENVLNGFSPRELRWLAGHIDKIHVALLDALPDENEAPDA
jgi:hypothetical protein